MSAQFSNKIELLKMFKEKVIQFFDALIELLPDEGDFWMLRIMFEAQIPIESAIKMFSERITPYADMVKNKDERFFIECTDLFSGIRKDKVSYFKDLWTSGKLTNDDKEALWKWFKLFLHLANQYEKY